MKTLIDCLKCGAQDAPNLGRGLCSSCYHRIAPKERQRYSLDAAKKRRMKRLNKQQSEPGPSSEPAQDPKMQAPGRARPRAPKLQARVKKNEAEVQDDPLAGFEFVPCNNAKQRSMEVYVDKPGKFLRFGAKITQEFNIQVGAHVHLYKGNNGLALKFLSEPDQTSYRLFQGGSAQKGHQNKVVLSAKRLVTDDIVFPGQRFEVRPHESERIIYLDAIEGAGDCER